MDQGISSLSFIDLSCLWGIPALVDANEYTAGHGLFYLEAIWNVL